jgi:hypothetical protein
MAHLLRPELHEYNKKEVFIYVIRFLFARLIWRVRHNCRTRLYGFVCAQVHKRHRAASAVPAQAVMGGVSAIGDDPARGLPSGSDGVGPMGRKPSSWRLWPPCVRGVPPPCCQDQALWAENARPCGRPEQVRAPARAIDRFPVLTAEPPLIAAWLVGLHAQPTIQGRKGNETRCL